jgi:hypothetical protein
MDDCASSNITKLKEKTLSLWIKVLSERFLDYDFLKIYVNTKVCIRDRFFLINF